MVVHAFGKWNTQFHADEARSNLGYKLVECVFEFGRRNASVEPLRSLSPMYKFVEGRSVVRTPVKLMLKRQLDVTALRAVECSVASVPDIGTTVGDQFVRSLESYIVVFSWDCVARPKMVEITMDLIDVEHDVLTKDKVSLFDLFAIVVGLRCSDGLPEDDPASPLAFGHVSGPSHHPTSSRFPLRERPPVFALETVAVSMKAEQERIHAAVTPFAEGVAGKTSTRIIEPRLTPWQCAQLQGVEDLLGDLLTDLILARHRSSPIELVKSLGTMLYSVSVENRWTDQQISRGESSLLGVLSTPIWRLAY